MSLVLTYSFQNALPMSSAPLWFACCASCTLPPLPGCSQIASRACSMSVRLVHVKPSASKNDTARSRSVTLMQYCEIHEFMVVLLFESVCAAVTERVGQLFVAVSALAQLRDERRELAEGEDVPAGENAVQHRVREF